MKIISLFVILEIKTLLAVVTQPAARQVLCDKYPELQQCKKGYDFTFNKVLNESDSVVTAEKNVNRLYNDWYGYLAYKGHNNYKQIQSDNLCTPSASKYTDLNGDKTGLNIPGIWPASNYYITQQATYVSFPVEMCASKDDNIKVQIYMTSEKYDWMNDLITWDNLELIYENENVTQVKPITKTCISDYAYVVNITVPFREFITLLVVQYRSSIIATCSDIHLYKNSNELIN